MPDRRRRAGWLPRGLALACLAVPALAEAPDPPLPRVLYGNPGPQVLYGPASPTPAPIERAPPPVMPPAPPPEPRGSLTLETGPAYLPPTIWVPPGTWRPPARWPPREAPRMPAPYVSPRGGAFEPPLPQGRYVGRPPGAAPEQLRYGRPPGP